MPIRGVVGSSEIGLCFVMFCGFCDRMRSRLNNRRWKFRTFFTRHCLIRYNSIFFDQPILIGFFWFFRILIVDVPKTNLVSSYMLIVSSIFKNRLWLFLQFLFVFLYYFYGGYRWFYSIQNLSCHIFYIKR